MKTEHQNPEFGHKWGEFFFKSCKKVHLHFTMYFNIILTIMLLTQCTLIYYCIIVQCVCIMGEGVKLRKLSILVVNWFSSCLSFFQSASTASYTYFHYSYLHNYYNYSRTLCIKCWYLSISYWDLKKFHYFADTTERGVWGWKEAQRQGEVQDFTDNSILASSYHLKLSSASFKTCEMQKASTYSEQNWLQIHNSKSIDSLAVKCQ